MLSHPLKNPYAQNPAGAPAAAGSRTSGAILQGAQRPDRPAGHLREPATPEEAGLRRRDPGPVDDASPPDVDVARHSPLGLLVAFLGLEQLQLVLELVAVELA